MPALLPVPLLDLLGQYPTICDEMRAEVYYPLPLHPQPCFAKLGYARGDFPVRKVAVHATCALPIYPELSMAMQAMVVDAMADWAHG